MNVYDIQNKLFDTFKTLNDFSGVQFITDDNVVYNDNTRYTPPQNKRWFRLTFLSDKPQELSMGEDALTEYAGILQIDVCTPLDKGESEAMNKFGWLEKLFYRGALLDFVTINRCYIANKTAESDHFKTVVRVEWDSTLNK